MLALLAYGTRIAGDATTDYLPSGKGKEAAAITRL